MSTLRVGLASIPVEENAFQKNLQNVTQVVENHADESLDLFVFGEATLTGLDVQDFESRSFPETKVILDQINILTKRFTTSVCVGFIEQERDRHYLTHLLSCEGITCGVQRKVFARNPTKSGVYWSGKQIHPIRFRDYRVVILACADWLLSGR